MSGETESTPTPEATAADAVHTKLKQQGNKFFAMGKYDAAIEAYTEAICMCPTAPTYYTNRALCHLKKENYDTVMQDCRKAISLDSQSVKAHYFMGLAHDKLGDSQTALVSMEKALDICNMQAKQTQSVSFVNEIRETIKNAKKELATRKIQERLAYVNEMRMDMADLMASERANAEELVRAGGGTEEDINAQLAALDEKLAARRSKWDKLFEKISPTRVSALDIPDFLCCKISMEICADPCVTPDGITYERGLIEGHLRRGNLFDPVTRNPLTLAQLYPNLNIRQAIDAYYSVNPWADELE